MKTISITLQQAALTMYFLGLKFSIFYMNIESA